jgi:hypothetical protein
MKNFGYNFPIVNKIGIYENDFVTVRNVKMSGNKFSTCTSLHADRHDKSKEPIFKKFVLNALKMCNLVQ